MAYTEYRACIAACDACAGACDYCASACIAEEESRALARCIRLDLDCATLCRTASALLARDSDFALEACRLCVTACEACAAECARHDMDHCRVCAEACRNCAEECQRTIGQAPEAMSG